MDREGNILSLARAVHHIARKLSIRCPQRYDDYVQAGWVGAIEAVDRYDAARGATLTTFAWRRIKGSIIDYTRDGAMATRGERECVVPLSSKMEVRDESGIVTQKQEFSDFLLSEDLYLRINNILDARCLMDKPGMEPRIKSILYMTYWREMNREEVGKMLNVNYTRISQLHSAAIKQLRRRAGK